MVNVKLSGIETTNVTSMYNMFEGCSKLQKVDMSNLNVRMITDMSYMFYNCSSLNDIDFSGWDTTNLNNTYYMFYGCSSLENLDLSFWNTKNLVNANRMFYGCAKLANLNVGSWNTTHLIDTSYMFYNCSSLTGIDLSSWNTSNVSNMKYMFYNCNKLTTIFVSDYWTISGVSSYYNGSEMFTSCTNLVGAMSYNSSYINYNYANYSSGYLTYKAVTVQIIPSTTELTTSGVTVSVTWPEDTTDMSKLVSVDGGATWNEYTGEMIVNENCTIKAKLVNSNNEVIETATLCISNIDSNPPIVMAISEEIENINKGRNIGLGNYFKVNVNGVSDYKVEFFDTTKGNKIVTNINQLGIGTHVIKCVITKGNGLTATANKNINIMEITEEGVYWDIYKISGDEYHLVLSSNGKLATGYTEEQFWLAGNENIGNGLSSNKWNGYTEKIKKVIINDEIKPVSVKNYFYNLKYVTQFLNINNINMSNVTDTSYMFYGCERLWRIDLNIWDMSRVTNMEYMFYGCSNLIELNVDKLNTNAVQKMNYAFYGCRSIKNIDLSGWNTEKVNDMKYMFCDCISLRTIYVSDRWSTQSVQNSEYMFSGCDELKGVISYEYDYRDATYANYENGYLTYKAYEP